MSKIHESSTLPTRNFTMLSRKMLALFMHYILGGRIRAPPEAELSFLISTFQNGAKTHRRALQSKFKSWAKRMVVENYKLKLIYTGKEILPIEDSCKVVMQLHCQGHLSVDQVIKQVQKNYTWTKKNFGLDRETVVDFILKNCDNLDCIRAVESRELIRNYKCNDFIKDVIRSSESCVQNQIYQCPVSATTCGVCTWPVGHPSPASSCDIENKFSNNLETTNMENMNPASNNSAMVSSLKENPKNNGLRFSETKNGRKANTPLRIAPRSFRKPRNTIDLQALLSAAEQHSDYPAVLYSPKTKFLGSFGLAPKRICSKRTLSKVEKEKKRRKAHYIQNIMNIKQNRKNLRDRNKLSRIKGKEQVEKRAYLGKFRRGSVDEALKMAPPRASGGINDDSYYVEGDESNNNIVSSADDSEIEIVEIVSKNEEPEVIEIVSSSDDESSGRNLKSLLKENRTTSLKKNSGETKTSGINGLNRNELAKKATDCVGFTGSSINFENPNRYYPIFRKPYAIPPNTEREVAVLSSSERSHQNKPLPSIRHQVTKSVMNSQVTKSTMNSHVTKSMMSSQVTKSMMNIQVTKSMMNSHDTKCVMNSHDTKSMMNSQVTKSVMNSQVTKSPMNSEATKSVCFAKNSQDTAAVCSMNGQATTSVCSAECQVTKTCSMKDQASKSLKVTKDMMQGKKAILQPISGVMTAKGLDMQKLPTPGIANKIPAETNIYLVQKQPSGLIKMVPYSRIVTTNDTTAQCSKEIPKGDRPVSVVNPVNHIGNPSKTKYRSIRPAPPCMMDMNRQKVLDANKHLIDEEMVKLSKWIGGMKSTMARTYFQLNVQRSKQRLESQLNVAIALVKNIRRKLYEIEKAEERIYYNDIPNNGKSGV